MQPCSMGWRNLRMILHSGEQFRAIKNQNKHALAGLIESKFGLEISPDALFDVQIKRLHEYKPSISISCTS